MIVGDTLKVNSEVFFIPYGSRYILYAPLKRIVALVDEFAKNQIESDNVTDKFLIHDLKKYEFYKRDKLPSTPNTNTIPTSATIFLTTDCNLRCIYCYASAGTHKDTMSKDQVKKIIDKLVENAKKAKRNRIHITFHGGGEPTYKWDLLKWSVEYAQKVSKENNLKLSTSISTNLFLSESQLKWLAKNINSIQISFDGYEDVQNYQRPAAGGKPTFKIVFRNIKLLDKLKKPYSIRSTITNYSLDKMIDIFKFFIKNMKYVNRIQFEPINTHGRGAHLNVVNVDKYIENLKKIFDIASRNNILFRTAEMEIDRIVSFNCGACGTNKVFLPTGDITSCFEVDYKEDPRSKYFFIGNMDKDGNITIDDKKTKILSKRTIYNMNKCKNCFAKYNCGGGCLAKTNDLFSQSDYICKITKEMMKYLLERMIEQKKVVGLKIHTNQKLSPHIFRLISFRPSTSKKSRIFY